MSESKEFRQKNRAKPSQSAHFATLFFKKPMHLLKDKEQSLIFYCKNRCAYKFYVFAIKSALRNISESSKFRFENSFNALSLVLNQYRLNLLQPSICITIVEIYIRKFIQTCPCFFNRYVPLNVSLLILFRFVCIPETLISK